MTGGTPTTTSVLQPGTSSGIISPSLTCSMSVGGYNLTQKGKVPMSKRLAGYDYSQPGYYFVTICTQQHRLVFGNVVDDQMSLRGPGQIAQSMWVTLPRRFAHVKLDAYVFMPNHLHAIVVLSDLDPTHTGSRAALWEIIRVFKAATSYHIRRSEG